MSPSGDDQLPARKTAQAHERTQRDADDSAEEQRRARHLQRQNDDLEQRRIERKDQADGLCKTAQDFVDG